ncbi:hypothetical protein PIB30_070834 [Stylosanthes scabra]|uniref:Uncharacterized protein n=1 Tax=Stylosanthes scabra TaxID=79078 RepID=A0ABU6ZMB7_9FABA|nr:hypothetical protein [Stylosanthes scabra]
MYHLLCNPRKHPGTPHEQLLTMFAPIPLWRGKLYGALDHHGIWNVPYRKKQKFYCFFVLKREFRIIEGLSISQEESGSSSSVTLREFQSQFLNASISYPTQSLAQDTDPWGGPLSQDPYNYEDEPCGRVYPELPSLTHVDAGLTEKKKEALLSAYEGGEYNLREYDYYIGYDEEYTDVTTDHEPITKYSP